MTKTMPESLAGRPTREIVALLVRDALRVEDPVLNALALEWCRRREVPIHGTLLLELDTGARLNVGQRLRLYEALQGLGPIVDMDHIICLQVLIEDERSPKVKAAAQKVMDAARPPKPDPITNALVDSIAKFAESAVEAMLPADKRENHHELLKSLEGDSGCARGDASGEVDKQRASPRRRS